MPRTTRRNPIGLFFIFVLFVSFVVDSPARAGEFQFKDGDRVALVGSTLIEREQKYGYWELALTTRHPDKNITFRNLGWSGDTVWGESRVGFDLDNPQKGFDRLRDAVLAVKPTVIIIGYGMNESFAGEAGLPRFKEGLSKLLDAFAPTKARIVLLSPVRYQDRGYPPSDPPKENKNLALYRDSIRDVALKRGHHFVNFFDMVLAQSFIWETPAFTDNGIHPTQFGYWRYAGALEHGLGYKDRDWQINIDQESKTAQASAASVDKLLIDPLRFEAKDIHLPLAWPNPRKPRTPVMLSYQQSDALILEQFRKLAIKSLPPGNYVLQVDGREMARGSALDWSFGRLIDRGLPFDQAEKLRQVIIEKNQLFFHRYRPQNETYLFGFRKYEQGQNAVEVPQFDALIEAKEKEIAKLRVPVKHTYELVPVEK
jgi:lysophospholipase L1-like esterase